MSLIRATPFHSRTADANRLNAWSNRNGCTFAAHYGDPSAECIAARVSAVVADISWRSRIVIEGTRAEEFLSRLMTRNPAQLTPGNAFKALWLTDSGGVRGAGALARFGRESFQLIATETDLDWITRSAALFDVQVREIAEEEGGLAIIGPYARKIVEAAGLDGALEAQTFRKSFWRSFDVTLSRFGEHGGYELWCKADDAPLVWNRIAKAGKAFALRPAGLNAMDVLDLEAGVPRPGRDYRAAREAFAQSPSPFDLGLESLTDADHELFNGRSAFLQTPRMRTRVGIEWDDETPAPNTPLMQKDVRVGETMSSVYSPALQRAIALATVETSVADPGMQLTMFGKSVRVVALPFLPAPGPIGE
jgi:aminomethyltransferase